MLGRRLHARARRNRILIALGVGLLLASSLALIASGRPAAGPEPDTSAARSPDGTLISTMYTVPRPRGLLVTSGGWTYCQQIRRLAVNTNHALLCGRFGKDGYVSPGLRSRRHLDWGNPRYLARFAERIEAARARVGGELILIGVSYSGFGVATLASHHPEIRPDRLIVIDSYLDLVARRRHAQGPTGAEIDQETGGTLAALRERSVSVAGLDRMLRRGTRLTVIWSISDEENRMFRGATCARDANAEVLSQLATATGSHISAWVTVTQHGHNLWNHGRDILAGKNPGREVRFVPGAPIPENAYCI